MGNALAQSIRSLLPLRGGGADLRWRGDADRRGWWRFRQSALPVAAVAGLLTLVLIAARHERASRVASLEQASRSYRVQLARRVERILEHQIRSLQVMALALDRFESDRDREVAAQCTAQVTSATRTLQWFGPDGARKLAIRDSKPDPSAGDERLPADWASLWAKARHSLSTAGPPSTPEAFVSRGFTDFSGPGVPATVVEVLVPIRAGSPGDGEALAAAPGRGPFDGVVAGTFSVDRLMRPITSDTESQRFHITVRDAGRQLFESAASATDSSTSSAGAEPEPIRVYNANWEIRTSPTAATRAAVLGNTPWAVLAGGTLVTILVAGGFAQAGAYRQRELRQARSYAAAVERLHAVSAAIGARLTSDDVLAQLAAASAELIGVSKVRVSFVTHAPDGTLSLKCLASFGWPHGTDLDFPLARTPYGRKALETREVVVMNQMRVDAPSSIMAVEMGVQSLMLVPIIVGDRPIGLLSLCDRQKGLFTPDRQQLGRLWAAQAAVVLANNQLHRKAQRSLQAQHELMGQRERLSTITTKMYAEKTLAGTLEQITRLSIGMLGVDDCSVLLRPPGGSEDELVLTASNPEFARFNIPRDITSRSGWLRRIYANRRVDVMPNASIDPQLDPRFRQAFGNVSIMTIPLYQNDQQPLGLLAWLRKFPGPFSPEQMGLAEIFAARAAVALENARLHEQTHQDGQTKAMLLRELNHRVKNNLAGIVGLMQATEMIISEESRPAVARLAQRVRTIAKAHELFVGGATRISVRELVEQVLSPVTAVSVGVGINVFCHDVTATLRTDRAVSMAMVLHELAFNAAFHGCDPDGHIEVHARTLEQELVIEVIDSGLSTAAPPRLERSGMGLELVRGLVKRELRGRFALEQNARGGSTAVIRVPLEASERVAVHTEEVH